jgi:hypothetical protein
MHPYSRAKAVSACLGIGLVMRDLETAQYHEPDMPGLPAVLQSTKLGFPHFEALATTCKRLVDDFKTCLQNVPGKRGMFPVLVQEIN